MFWQHLKIENDNSPMWKVVRDTNFHIYTDTYFSYLPEELSQAAFSAVVRGHSRLEVIRGHPRRLSLGRSTDPHPAPAWLPRWLPALIDYSACRTDFGHVQHAFVIPCAWPQTRWKSDRQHPVPIKRPNRPVGLAGPLSERPCVTFRTEGTETRRSQKPLGGGCIITMEMDDGQTLMNRKSRRKCCLTGCCGAACLSQTFVVCVCVCVCGEGGEKEADILKEQTEKVRRERDRGEDKEKHGDKREE